MNKILAFIILLIGLTACSKDYLEVMPENILEIESVHTGEAYEIQVLLPENYTINQEYQVVYLLDGYYHFDNMRSVFTEESYLDDVILVGIFYRDYPLNIAKKTENLGVNSLLTNSGKVGQLRTMDFTYPKNLDSTGGGGDLFYEFLATELVPLIDQNYSIDTDNRTIMGHSYGAYFVMFQMMEYYENPIFKNIISLDTQIWWADLYLLEKEKELYENGATLPFKFYMGAAKFANFDTNALIQEFEEQLISHNLLGLEFKSEKYNDGHSFSVRTGFELGLKYIFDE